MSALYNLEPQPTARVVLKTTSGDIALELFGKQAPLASRNFLQHCLDGYYDNTIFHRLVPGFVIQGGDPTGTGAGGESALEDGKPFADEFHPRLKYTRRGLLGMANTGVKNDNGSQFFLTLGETKELTGRNTLFGRVEGNTIFNVVNMGDAELMEGEGNERPMFPTVIKSAEILVNPFEGMVRRAKAAEVTTAEKPHQKKKTKKKTGKQMLSFGGDDDADDMDTAALASRPKFNPKMVQAETAPALKKKPEPQPNKQTQPPVPAPTSKPTQPTPAPRTQPTQPPTRRSPSRSSSPSVSASPSPAPSQSPDRDAHPSKATAQQTQAADAEIATLRASLKRSAPTPAPTSLPPQKKPAPDPTIPAGARKGASRKPDDARGRAALADFAAFKARLDAAAVAASSTAKRSASAAAGTTAITETTARADAGADAPGADDTPCDLHLVPRCQSCRDWAAADADGAADAAAAREHEGLFAHRLTFARDRLGKDLEWKRQNEKELVVIDPREREREFGAEKGRRGKGSRVAVG